MSRKLNRAKELLESLRKEVKIFLDSQPYRIGTKRDSDARLIYFLTEVKEVPENITTLAGDILQNLRSALDHKAYELFRANSAGEGKHVYFPIDRDKASYEASKERKTKGMSQAAKDFFDSIKPYKDGNHILWQIHELNNLDKHRTLVTSGSKFESMDIGAHAMNLMMEAFGGTPKDFPKMPLFIRPADNLFPLTAGQELFIDGPNAKEIPDMQFVFKVVINESNIAEGEEITQLLDNMTKEVEKQISDISTTLGI
jgi:hypothetical protein